MEVAIPGPTALQAALGITFAHQSRLIPADSSYDLFCAFHTNDKEV